MIVKFEGDRYEVDNAIAYMARDASGEIYCYTEKPHQDGYVWTNDKSHRYPQLIDSPDNTWKHSLVEVKPELASEWILCKGFSPESVFSATDHEAQEYLKQCDSSYSIKRIDRIAIK